MSLKCVPSFGQRVQSAEYPVPEVVGLVEVKVFIGNVASAGNGNPAVKYGGFIMHALVDLRRRFSALNAFCSFDLPTVICGL
jgi:hypothetical protein